MTNQFKKGDKIRCINAEGWGGITKGNEYEVVGMSSGVCVHLLKDDDGRRSSKPFASRFELVAELNDNGEPQPDDQKISTEFEIRWHVSGSNPLGLTDGRVLSRRPTQQLAEEFIAQNAGNYAAGEFSITQVTVLKRIQQVRRVKCVPVTTYKLEDA
ncbi:hypothetical protein [Burkholderia ubonensis]|uniref:hypothetical protein n=1 Tax=Burkholderia ubonensis TaxID=101571 RepID=UPI00075AAFB6|nr:hypothetical protein [Burkholderia ubonensis]KVD50585.1 hypothetical protein WI86_15810 [Burkholderia ubonensis]